MRPRDMISNHRLVTWRLVEGKPGLNFNGVSATEILDHLNSEDLYDDNIYDSLLEGRYGAYGRVDEEESDGYGYRYEYDEACLDEGTMAEETEMEIEAEGTAISVECDESGEDDDDDDAGSFCEVGFVWEQVEVDGEDGWCLVQEM